jgi:hypothetical protein
MRAIFVCDDNPAYLGFWKYQAEHMWNRFGMKSLLYFISNNTDHSLFTSDFAEVRQIPLLSTVPPIVQALFAKWYYPTYETSSERIFICDIDCFVLSRKFVKYVEKGNSIFHLQILNNQHIPGYYVAGTPEQLCPFFRTKDISFEYFCLRALQESKHIMPEQFVSSFSKEASKDWKYFGSEEHYATECLKSYTGTTDCPFALDKMKRICRSQNSMYSVSQLLNDEYLDYHCPRPFEKYKDVIQGILNQVKNV